MAMNDVIVMTEAPSGTVNVPNELKICETPLIWIILIITKNENPWNHA